MDAISHRQRPMHQKEPWTSFDTVNDRWYGPDKHYWFRTTITIPESFDGKNLWMRVHAGLDEWDDGRNPQFLLFANGEVIQVWISTTAKYL